METRSGDMQYNTTLPKGLVKKLKSEARTRKVSQKQITIAALTNFFEPPELEEGALIRRLSRIESKQVGAEEKLEILSETLALFIQVWFSNTFELAEREKAAASLQGEKRFNKFLEALNKRLASGIERFEEFETEAVPENGAHGDL